MADPFKKVASGDPLDFPAQLYNLVVAAVQDYLRRINNGGAGQEAVARDGTIINVRNDTADNLDAFSVVALGDPVIDPNTDNLTSFQAGPILIGSTPTTADLGRFAITLAPIAADAIGLGIVAGVAVVQVDDGDGSTDFADVADGVTDSLEGNSSGAARILWRAAGTGKQWAVVRFGGAGASKGQYQDQGYVMVAQNEPGWDFEALHPPVI